MTCDHSRPEPFTDDLKILPNFTNHRKIKNGEEVKKLEINFKPATFIFSGIGEKFSNLKGLYIEKDDLKTVKRSDFSDLDHLQILSLSSNPLKGFPEDVFWDLNNIEILKLHECELEYLPENLFVFTNNLVELDLAGNIIRNLPKNLFKNNLKIQKINLINNKLMRIDVDFTKLPELKTVDMHLNDCIKSDYSRDFPLSSSVQTVEELQAVITSNCNEIPLE